MANEDVLERARNFDRELSEADKQRRMVDLGALHLIHALAAELREAREDTRMLDFIEDCGVPGLAWESRMSTTGRGYRLHQHALGNGVHATARDAIDAAMKTTGGEGQP